MSEQNNLLNEALKYAQLGYNVFPCKPEDKRPLTKRGFKEATTDPDAIRTWWSKTPNANIAIEARGLVVIDVDPQGFNWLNGLQDKLDQSGCAIQITPRGGRHYFFKRPRDVAWRCTAGKLAVGVDVRTTGGYVLVSPSKTIDGRYSWIVPLKDVDALPEPPEELVAALDATCAVEATCTPGGEGVIAAGQRNAALTSVAGRLRRIGFTEEELRTALIAINASRCRPPLDEQEVSRIAASVARYAAEYDWRKLAGGNLEEAIALEVTRDTALPLRFCDEVGVWYVWDGRCWKQASEDYIAGLIRSVLHTLIAALPKKAAKRLRNHCTARFFSSVRQHLRAFTDIHTPYDRFDSNPRYINVQNGVLDLDTFTLLQHQPDYLLSHIAGAAYDPEAQYQPWDRFIESALPDPEVRLFVQKAVGYSLLGYNALRRLFQIAGPSGTGKTTFLGALKAAFGSYLLETDYAAFLDRNNKGGPAPELVKFKGKRVVIANESSAKAKLDDSRVKQLTGLDWISARDLYRAPIEFKFYGVIWLATNVLPRVSAEDDAIWERLCVIPFENQVAAADRDLMLLWRFENDPKAKAAILRWIIEGAKRYRAEGLGIPDVIKKATEGWKEENDPTGPFCEELIEVYPGVKTPTRDVLQAYKSWALKNQQPVVSDRRFYMLMTARGFKSKTIRIGTNLTRVYEDVRIRPSFGPRGGSYVVW